MKQPIDIKPPSYFQTIFANSRLYGGGYYGEHLQPQQWRWPSSTFLSRRLREIRMQGEEREQDND